MIDQELQAREHDVKMTVSVVVPCAHTHVHHLRALLANLRAQSRQPDQIVFAVSGCEASEVPRLDGEIVHSREPHTAGSNRNRGLAAARGDILIYQDADDLPHPQRVEIIAFLFERYRIDHLMHLFDRSEDQRETFSFKRAVRRTAYRTAIPPNVANGNPAVARSLLSSVRWPEYSHRGEDVEFNTSAYACTKQTAVVTLPLLTYRQHLSSFPPRRRRRRRVV